MIVSPHYFKYSVQKKNVHDFHRQSCLERIKHELVGRIADLVSTFENETIPNVSQNVLSGFREAQAEINAIGDQVNELNRRKSERQNELVERRNGKESESARGRERDRVR